MADWTLGLITAALVGWVWMRRKELPVWKTLDALSVFVAVMLMTFSLMNFVDGRGFGAPTQMVWGIEQYGVSRHPSALYELAAGGLMAALIWPRKGMRARPAGLWKVSGARILTLVGLYAASKVLLEAFRGDSVVLVWGIRSAQVGAWVLLGLSLLILGKRMQRKVDEPEE